MKVVLTKDVRNMGRAGQVLEVSDGHAVNFLFPRKLAVNATATNMKQAEMRQKQYDDQKAINAGMIKEKLAYLAENTLTITKKANEKGHLYDAVGVDDLAKTTGLPQDVIALEKPIKEVGSYEVPVSSGETFGSFQLVIVAE